MGGGHVTTESIHVESIHLPIDSPPNSSFNSHCLSFVFSFNDSFEITRETADFTRSKNPTNKYLSINLEVWQVK